MSVTAIIPARDAASTIGSAVRSVLEQTRGADRIIVVDDGSRDCTSSLARAAGAEIIQASNPGLGPAAARNDALRTCKTRWAAFLDADDRWLPHHLETAIPILEREQPALLAGSAFRLDGGGNRVGRSIARLTRRDPLEALLLGELLVTTSAAIVDVERSLGVGGFDHRFRIPSCEDWDLWSRLASPGSIATSSAPTVAYYVEDSQSRASRLDLIARYRRDALDRCLQRTAVSSTLERRARSWLALDLAQTFLKFGRRREARAMLLECVRRTPVRPGAWGLLAMACFPSSVQASIRRAKRRLARDE